MMTDIKTLLKNLFDKMAEVLGRALTSAEKKKVQEDLGIKDPSTTVEVFTVNYFVDPNQTPLSSIDWSKMKGRIKRVAVRVYQIGADNASTTELKANYKYIADLKTTLQKQGIALYAWVWAKENSKFSTAHAKYLKDFVTGFMVDTETYTIMNMEGYYKSLRATIGTGKTLVACVKPEGWDGEMRYDMLMKYCNAVAPMVYLGDYGKSVNDLKAFMKLHTTKYPGKITPILETYKSDANVIAKDYTTLLSEIEACKPYTKRVWLFRLGLDNFLSQKKTSTNTNTIKGKIEKGTGKTFNNFTEFYNIVKNTCKYSYYFDDKKTLQEEISHIITDINGQDDGSNCCDWAQLGSALAKEMGYTVVLHGIFCPTDQIYHAVFTIKGKEFSNTTVIDLAAAASDNYNIGQHWCNNPTDATANPGWLPYESL